MLSNTRLLMCIVKVLYSNGLLLTDYIVVFQGETASIGPRPPHYRGFRIILRPHTRQDSSRWVLSPTQRIYLTTPETEIHAFGVIRTRNPSPWIVRPLDSARLHSTLFVCSILNKMGKRLQRINSHGADPGNLAV